VAARFAYIPALSRHAGEGESIHLSKGEGQVPRRIAGHDNHHERKFAAGALIKLAHDDP
jgi:hypothetical protein